MPHHIGQVTKQQLLLQGYRRRCDHQFLATGASDREGGDKIGNGFSRAGSGLDYGNRRLHLRIGKGIGDLCNHLPLAPPWYQA